MTSPDESGDAPAAPTLAAITLAEIRRAQALLRGVIAQTPLVRLHEYRPGSTSPDDEPGEPAIWLKPEIHQPVGSFKLRGVYHAAVRLPDSRRARGIATVSAGNTAQALAYCGRLLGVPARAVMPDVAPRAKIDAFRGYGGEPVLIPRDEVFAYMRERRWEREDAAFIHPWTDRDVMIGHATIGLEIAAACPRVDTVYVPVGGGGLLGGVGAALELSLPGVRVVAVEPEGCPSLWTSLRAGCPQTVQCDTICDGVAVPYITDEMFPLLARVVDDAVLVSDDAVRAAVRRLAVRDHMVVEPAGALAVAAALADAPNRGGVSVCLVTGGSIDPALLADILTAPA